MLSIYAAITLEQPSEYSRIGWDAAAALAVVPHRLAVNPKVKLTSYFFPHGFGQSMVFEITAPQRWSCSNADV